MFGKWKRIATQLSQELKDVNAKMLDVAKDRNNTLDAAMAIIEELVQDPAKKANYLEKLGHKLPPKEKPAHAKMFFIDVEDDDLSVFKSNFNDTVNNFTGIELAEMKYIYHNDDSDEYRYKVMFKVADGFDDKLNLLWKAMNEICDSGIYVKEIS